jgi:hypothetical protein
MHRLLEFGSVADETLTASLQSRIVEVCKGHMEWCFDIAQKSTSGSWASQYRPFGSKCDETDDIIHGATNFIKLLEIGQEIPQLENFIIEKLMRRLEGWLTQLKSTRNEKSGLWEEAKHEVEVEWIDEKDSYRVEVPQYDLCYSLQIWEAIKAVRSIVDDARSSHSSEVPKELEVLLEKLDFRDSFCPGSLQDLILDRFCFDHTFPTNEQLYLDGFGSHTEWTKKPKRLIAIARSGKQKPRFHWRADSFNLCDGYDGGFFDKATSESSSSDSLEPQPSNRLEEWVNTVKLQAFQHEALWKKPSRYALALLLAKHANISLDKTILPAAMVRTCQEVLLRSVLADGKIAEELNPVTKKPRRRLQNLPAVIYGIPYYLVRTIHPTPSGNLAISSASAKSAVLGTTWSRTKNYKFEKSVRSIRKRGFYATVNEANVFESPCEPDWLFDDPNFFTKEDRRVDEEGLREELEKLVEDTEEMADRDNVFSDSILQYHNDSRFGEDSDSEEYAAVVDVTKPGASSPGIECDENLCYPRELLELLRKKRQKKIVKKRLM